MLAGTCHDTWKNMTYVVKFVFRHQIVLNSAAPVSQPSASTVHHIWHLQPTRDAHHLVHLFQPQPQNIPPNIEFTSRLINARTWSKFCV